MERGGSCDRVAAGPCERSGVTKIECAPRTSELPRRPAPRRYLALDVGLVYLYINFGVPIQVAEADSQEDRESFTVSELVQDGFTASIGTFLVRESLDRAGVLLVHAEAKGAWGKGVRGRGGVGGSGMDAVWTSALLIIAIISLHPCACSCAQLVWVTTFNVMGFSVV